MRLWLPICSALSGAAVRSKQGGQTPFPFHHTHMKKYKITDIRWDDDQEVRDDLPTTVTVAINHIIPRGMTVEDVLSDWLSDHYGWLNLGFKFKQVK